MAKQKRILVLCPHPKDRVPGQRLKYEQYFSHWEQNGYTVTISPFITNSFQDIIYKKGFFLKKVWWTIYGYFRRLRDLGRIRRFDIVYVFLWVTPFGPPFFEWMVRKLSKKMIYDIDDLVYTKYEKGILRMLKGKEKPVFLMKHADHVITCTPYLTAFVNKYNQHTTDISSTINSETYIPVNPYSNDKKLTLGWSGSHSTSKYLLLLKDVLLELYKEKKFRLLVMGDPSFTIEGLEVEAIAWSEEKEIPTLQQIDIGLYPLPDEEWVLGKSGLKALQYMTLGIPTIATAVGANFRVIENGVSGFLVTSPEEWKEKLLLLMDNPDLRKQVGKKARERVEAHYSILANQPVYLSILDNLTGRPGKKQP
jgi:glycosyltransferase involved in cell wall biosynthesis